MNNKGLIMDPWGTPNITPVLVNEIPLMDIHWVLPSKNRDLNSDR